MQETSHEAHGRVGALMGERRVRADLCFGLPSSGVLWVYRRICNHRHRPTHSTWGVCVALDKPSPPPGGRGGFCQ